MKQNLLFNGILFADFSSKLYLLRTWFFVLTFGIGLRTSANNDPGNAPKLEIFSVESVSVTTNALLVSGFVKDELGQPLPGTNVLEKGTTNGTTTNTDGRYSISVSENSTLTFSFIGYLTSEIVVTSQTEINVTMRPDVKSLEEVVVIGYGTVKKSDLTGAVGSVNSEQLNQTLNTTLEQGLRGRVAGVQIVQSEGTPGAGFQFRIRGGTSINASNEPLIVVDGFPMETAPQPTSLGIGSGSRSSVFAGINPTDIASIEFLKDASTAALYGSRAANGVVLITTKSGAKGKNKISFNASYGVSRGTKKLALLNPDEYIQFYLDTGGNGKTYAVRDAQGDAVYDEIVFNNETMQNDTTWQISPASAFEVHDWQDELMRTAVTQDYNLTFSGGDKGTSYFASVGYLNQEGIIINSDFKRYTANFKIDQRFSDKFGIGGNTYMGYSQTGGVVSVTSDARQYSGVITNLMLYRPVFGYNDENEIQSPLFDRNGEVSNPYAMATQTDLTNNSFSMWSNAYANYKIAEGLVFEIKAGVNLSTTKRKSWYPGAFGYGKIEGGGIAHLGSDNSIGWLNENTLTYTKSIGIHAIHAVAGYAQQAGSWENMSTSASSFVKQDINVDNLGSAGNSKRSYSDRSEWGLRSWFLRANYTLKDKYIAEVAGRADGSSRFAEGNKWAFFPVVSLAWKVGEESFIKSTKLFDNLKLRASFGYTGNQAIESYASLARYDLGGGSNYAFNRQLVIGLASERLQNNDLTWETTRQLDIGIDMSIMQKRITLAADYYDKLTENLLLRIPVAYTTGYSDAWMNSGSIKNYGWEFSLNTVNLVANDFTWESNFNISFNKSRVVKLNGDLPYFYASGPNADIANDYIVQEGYPVGSMYGLVWDGVYQTNDFNDDGTLKEGVPRKAGITPKPGYMKFKDIVQDSTEHVINDKDRTIIGNGYPKHYGGFTNTFRYKGLELSVLLSWSYGNSIMNKNLVQGTGANIYHFNQYQMVADRWTEENPTNEMYGINGRMLGGGENIASTFFISDGSFLRLSNITLGYNLPVNLLSRMSIASARLFVSADNLHVWSNYIGYDPEVSVGWSALTPGVDYGAYPRSRTFRLGINLNF